MVGRSADGVHFATVATVTSAQFGAASLERPALVPLADGDWRLYVSCATPQSKHWWVEAIELGTGTRHMVLRGDAATAWKDVVVRRDGDRWHMWACRHALADGDDEADRMTSWYLTSANGIEWTLAAQALQPTPGRWDARGARIASVIGSNGSWTAFYDGRASASENWHERTGAALGVGPSSFVATGEPTPAGHTARYLSVVSFDRGYRLYWEASREDGAHELRTAYVPRPVSLSQS